MRKVIACKPIKSGGTMQISPEAGRLIRSIYRLQWITTFHKLTVFVVFLMLLLIVLVVTGR